MRLFSGHNYRVETRSSSGGARRKFVAQISFFFHGLRGKNQKKKQQKEKSLRRETWALSQFFP